MPTHPPASPCCTITFTGHYALVLAAVLATPALHAQDGALGPTFGDGGVVSTDFGRNERGYGLAVQPDGRIILGGIRQHLDVPDNSDLILARYHPDGSLDHSFGNEGVVIADLGASESISEVVIQPDGGILAGGSSLPDFLSSVICPTARPIPLSATAA